MMRRLCAMIAAFLIPLYAISTQARASSATSLPNKTIRCPNMIALPAHGGVLHFKVSARRVSCKEAHQIVYAFLTRLGAVVHEGKSVNDTFWTLQRYPGWRCVEKANSGGCSASRGRAADYS